MLVKKEKTLGVTAAKSGMDEKTARKYLKEMRLPSQLKKVHNWRTREDTFKEVWDEALSFLWNPGVEQYSIIFRENIRVNFKMVNFGPFREK
jgi:L-rhamnose mutarotase